MDVSTIQISKWRKAEQLGILLIDTTVKSGIPAFAPTWEMVLKHKAGTLSDEEYTELYKQMMRKSYVTNQLVWNELIKKPKVALACYCHPEKFCHRHILVKYIEGVCAVKGVPFRYLGEIE